MSSLRSPLEPSSIAAVALAFSLGCQESPVNDLGYTANELEQQTQPTAPLPPVAEFARDFAGVWFGEAEDPLALQSNAEDEAPAFRFPSGSTLIRLELTHMDTPYPEGSITFGSGTPPAPATDPDVGYPIADPNFDINSPFAFGRVISITEGFALRISRYLAPFDLQARGLTSQAVDQFYEEGRVVDGKLDINYNTNQIFESWCALQTSQTCPLNEGFVVDNDGACFVGPQQVPIDCQKLAMCINHICWCETDVTLGSSGEVVEEVDYCTYTSERDSTLTLRLSEEGLVGVFSDTEFANVRGFLQPVGAVHFRPAAP